MENPWIRLPDNPPFILPCDAESINVFNNRQRNTPFEIILDEMPSPYIGDPESPVVFLNLNPGYLVDESRSPSISHFRKIVRANLLHQFYEYPFYVLDQSLEGTPSGYGWFSQKFNPLMRIAGVNARDLSQKIFLVEYFPYRSQKCAQKWKNGILPSQKYAISLIEKAISRKAVIVIMRGESSWFGVAPTLEKYLNRYTLHNPQNVTISGGNLCAKGFWDIVEILRK